MYSLEIIFSIHCMLGTWYIWRYNYTTITAPVLIESTVCWGKPGNWTGIYLTMWEVLQRAWVRAAGENKGRALHGDLGSEGPRGAGGVKAAIQSCVTTFEEIWTQERPRITGELAMVQPTHLEPGVKASWRGGWRVCQVPPIFRGLGWPLESLISVFHVSVLLFLLPSFHSFFLLPLFLSDKVLC